MRPKCDACGIQGSEGEIFAREAIPFRGERFYCSNCHARLYRRVFQGILLALALAGAVGLAFVSLQPESKAGRILLNLFLFQAFMIAATVPHELGHALAGRWLGFDIHRVIIGFGTPLYVGRILGFVTELRCVPLGGLTIGTPNGARWLRLRWFLFALAGPAANFLVGVLVALFSGQRPSWNLNIGGTVDPVRLFMLANLLVVIENLVPFAVSTSHGRQASDGLALFQLLFLRRLPYVPNPVDEEQTPWLRRIRMVLRWLVAGCLFLCGAGCFWGAIQLGRALSKDDYPTVLWVGCFLAASMGLTFGWLGRRALSAPLMAANRQELAQPTHSHGVAGNLTAELNALSVWPQDSTQMLFQEDFQRLHSAGGASAAIGHMDAILARVSNNPALLWCKSLLLAESGQWPEAESILESLQALEGLSSTAKTELLTTRLRLVCRQGHHGRARELAEEFLASGHLESEKLCLLDALACVPFLDGLPAYLPEADRWSRQALAIQPDSLTLRGTRGAILIEQGRFDEGEHLLQEVLAKSEADIDQGICSFFLALAARQRGDRRTALRLARRAVRIHPVAWLQQRVAREFPELIPDPTATP